MSLAAALDISRPITDVLISAKCCQLLKHILLLSNLIGNHGEILPVLIGEHMNNLAMGKMLVTEN